MLQRVFAMALLAVVALAPTTEAATILGRGAANIAAVYESEFTMNGNDQAITSALVVEAGSLVSTDDGDTWEPLETRTFFRPGDIEIFVADEFTTGLPEVVADFAGFPPPNDVPDNQQLAPILATDGELTLGFSVDPLLNPTFPPTNDEDVPVDTFSTFTFNLAVADDGPPTVVAWRNDGTDASDVVLSNNPNPPGPRASTLSFAPQFGLQEVFNWTFADPPNNGTPGPGMITSPFMVDVEVVFAGGETPAVFLPAESYNFVLGEPGSDIPSPPDPPGTPVIPEPSTGIALLLFGGIGILSRRRVA